MNVIINKHINPILSQYLLLSILLLLRKLQVRYQAQAYRTMVRHQEK